MNHEMLYRSDALVREITGRTLTGIAVPFDRPTRVSDPGAAPYLESFARTAADRTIQQRNGRVPMLVRHDPQQDPIGVVTFTRSDAEGALLFEAPVSDTRRGSDYLTLARDGSMTSVSLGFRPIQASNQRMDGELVVVRTEIAIRELSLAPTGYAAYEEAAVTAIRTESEFDPIRLTIRRAAHRYLEV